MDTCYPQLPPTHIAPSSPLRLGCSQPLSISLHPIRPSFPHPFSSNNPSLFCVSLIESFAICIPQLPLLTISPQSSCHSLVILSNCPSPLTSFRGLCDPLSLAAHTFSCPPTIVTCEPYFFSLFMT